MTFENLCRSWAEAMRAALILKGIGHNPLDDNPVWPVFVATMPSDPTEAICVYDAGVYDDGQLMADGGRVIKPLGQVKVRSPNYGTMMDKCLAIEKVLDNLQATTVTVGGKQVKISCVMITSPTTPLGQEEKSRAQVAVINYRLTPSLLTVRS